MLSRCRDELICDMAQVYHIYDLNSLPASLIATLAVGLGQDSRTKLKIMGLKIPTDTILLAGIYDRLSVLLWSMTSDARKGLNQPEPILPKLLGKEEKSDISTARTTEEFEERWRKATGQEE